MNKERLIIKNFFTLKDVDVELGKYNVLIGEQASGKSLILKHLYFFRELINNYIMFYSDIDNLYNFIIKRYHEIFNLNFSENSYVEYSMNGYDIKIYNSQIIKFSDNLLNICNEYFNAESHQREINSYHGKGLSSLINRYIIPQKVYNNNKPYIGVNNFIPAVRVLLYNLLNNTFNILQFNLNIDYLLTEFGQDYQRARFDYENNMKSFHGDDIFQSLSGKILKGKFVYDFTGDLIQHANFSTKVIHASSGQQEFVPIYLILCDMFKNKGNLYIEEPEAHLYPSAQKAITELLVYVTNATKSDGLYITTHSPYILTVLNNLILANDVKDKQTIFDKDLLVPFEEVRAYYIADGTARDLCDTEDRLILADNLDKVSEQTALDFDQLLNLKYDDILLDNKHE